MLTFFDVIPTKDTIHRGESLNILGIMYNKGEDTSAVVSVWGKTDDEWRNLTSREYDILSEEHKHMYFTLDAELFTENFWGEEPEELEICISDTKPGKEQNGILIIVL